MEDAPLLISCGRDCIRRAEDGLTDHGTYAVDQLTKAIDYLTRARAALSVATATESEGP